MISISSVRMIIFCLLSAGSILYAHAQQGPEDTGRLSDLKTVIVTSHADSDSVIAIPPATSVRFARGNEKPAKDSPDLNKWLDEQTVLNGLQSSDLKPWHIVIT